MRPAINFQVSLRKRRRLTCGPIGDSPASTSSRDQDACLVAQVHCAASDLHVVSRSSSGNRISIQCHFDDCRHHRQRPVPSFLIFRRDYFEEAQVSLESRMNLGSVDDSRVVPEVAAAIDTQFANSSAETRSASEAAALATFWSHRIS